SFPDNRALVGEMLALERAARAARRGIWAHPFYRVLAPGEAAGFIDSFQLVEGRVVGAAVVKGRGYLNFGPDRRTDFTVTISPQDLQRFGAEWGAFESLEGRRVRVRGWLRSFDGPQIEATHPEQLEALPE
ncbi:MAG: thermonuclease family protein, partial [Alphaproteobacteria bacterium]